jgi:hypothetical protein
MSNATAAKGKSHTKLVTVTAGTPISLGAKSGEGMGSVVSVPVKAGQWVNVTAEGTWIYGGNVNSTADGDVTWQANKDNAIPLVSNAAPAGALIGIFIPEAYGAYVSDLSTDDTETNQDRFKHLMPRSILLGTHWRGASPYDGFLLLLMNDALGGYSDNSGSIDINVELI